MPVSEVMVGVVVVGGAEEEEEEKGNLGWVVVV